MTFTASWLCLIAGASTGLLGLVLLVWAIRGDRARGRRRCPKCWYDMAGVPGLTCPECGREASVEREFAKPRRRWLIAAIATGVFITGGCAAGWPFLQGVSYAHLVPTWALVRFAPLRSPVTQKSPQSLLSDELVARGLANELSSDQWQKLLDRVSGNRRASFPLITTRWRWPRDAPLSVNVEALAYFASFGWQDGLCDGLTTHGFLPGELKVRLRLLTPALGYFGDWVEGEGDLWEFNTIRVGWPDPDVREQRIEAEVIVLGAVRWRTVIGVEVAVDGTLVQSLRPRDFAQENQIIEQELRPVLGNFGDGVRIRVSGSSTLKHLQHVAVGARIEILHEGRVVGRTAPFWQIRKAGGHELPVSWVVDEPARETILAKGWELVVSGDQLLALSSFEYAMEFERVPYHSEYWAGTIRMPLRTYAPPP